MTNSISRPVRIGAVSYLNSKPLIEGLGSDSAQNELHLDYPSRLAEGLADDRFDVALVPSIEVLRHQGFQIVSDACVAARGPVMSVKLYSRVPWSKVRRLALDEGSRTSAALARIMLAERYGVEPDLESLPLERSTDSSDADAVLLIGDRAIPASDEKFAETWDLGEQWQEWTGLPFVFALWAVRTETKLIGVEEMLCRARDRGVKNCKEIARREAPLLGIPIDRAVHYLTESLHFRLGPAERSGLRLFHQLASQLGLGHQGVDLVFRDCVSAR